MGPKYCNAWSFMSYKHGLLHVLLLTSTPREKFFPMFFTVVSGDFVCCFDIIAYQKDYDNLSSRHLFIFGKKLIPFSKGGGQKKGGKSEYHLPNWCFMKCFKRERHESVRYHCRRKGTFYRMHRHPCPEKSIKAEKKKKNPSNVVKNR